MRRSFVYLFLTLTLMLVPGHAQTLGFGVSITTTSLFEPELTLSDWDLGASELSLRLAGGVSGPLELGVTARETQSFGPLGNLTFYAEGAVREADFRVRLGAEGVIATVAGEAHFSLSTLQPGVLSAADVYGARPERFFTASKGLKADLALSASYRLNRTLILSAEPNFYFVNEANAGLSPGLSLKTAARFVKLVGQDDGYIYLDGQLDASGGDYAALGFGYDLNRRGLPNLQASLWLGLNTNGLKPGAGLELSQTFRDAGTSYSLSVNAEPFRADVLPYRAALGFAQLLGQNELQLDVYGTLANTYNTPVLTGKLSYLRRF